MSLASAELRLAPISRSCGAPRVIAACVRKTKGPDSMAGGPSKPEFRGAETRLPEDCAPVGRVVLVGAGPGDPDLLTVKAARLIGEAEVIFADRLVGKGVLALASPSAEMVYVGKSK